MKIFHCDHCEQLVFFENSACLSCGHPLAFLPDIYAIGSLAPTEDGTLQCPAPAAQHQRYRLCDNYTQHNVCNWAIVADDPNPLCIACRTTQVIPDLTRNGNLALWYLLETAKRRLIYNLMQLKLPLADKRTDPANGLAFEFLADPEDPTAPRVLTGHADGLITISLAEADDAEREKRRNELNEPYRTLLGHFRHEIGHYYWDRLIRDSDRLSGFRALFGEERADYNAAVTNYYAKGAPVDWQTNFISAYATMHPWEDWAECWAHYLHMFDTLETAACSGLSLKPKRRDEPALNAARVSPNSFDAMIDAWAPLTYVLNNLNRGLGQPDGYPFVLSTPVIEKLRFIHDTIRSVEDN